MTATPKGDRGKSLESLIAISGRGVVDIEKLPKCGGFFIGRKVRSNPSLAPSYAKEPPAFVSQRIGCDFMGTVIGSGRGIFFDAKQCALATSFPLSNTHNIKDHQREFLIRMGRAGAISGLIVESTVKRTILWLGWQELAGDVKSIRWDRWAWWPPLAQGLNATIDFRKLIAIADAPWIEVGFSDRVYPHAIKDAPLFASNI
jgi:hypothetical protein